MKGWNIVRVEELKQWKGAETEDEGIPHSLVIAENVSAVEFLKKAPERGLLCKIALVGGKVIIYELNSKTHGKVQTEIVRQLGNFNVNHANNGLEVATEVDILLGPNTVRRSDNFLMPRGLPNRPPGQGMDGGTEPYPTFVAEVGYSESLDSLHSLAVEYFNARSTIQVYLAVKIWARRDDNTFSALALLYRRNAPNPTTTPVQAISFGSARIHGNSLNTMPGVIPPLITGNHGALPQACDGGGLPAFHINIPLANLYHGVPGGVPANLQPLGNFQIDLYQIQIVAY